MVGHHPTNKLIGREPIPHQKHPKAQSFPHPPCSRHRISRISHTFMRLSRRRGQVTHVLLTRSPLIHTHHKGRRFTVRLACVKHAASVRPEPGSNSPNKTNKTPTKPHTTKHEAKPEQQSEKAQKTRPHSPTQPPTTTARSQANQNKTSPKNHTQQTSHAQPPGPNGIKNMTHYRVLKQHTQSVLAQTSQSELALTSNPNTIGGSSTRCQPQRRCLRSHLITHSR